MSLLLRGGQVLACLRQTSQFAPQSIDNTPAGKMLVFLGLQALTTARDEVHE